MSGALVFGLLLGCFYAAVSIGLSVAFGLLDVPHIAHPSILVAGAYGPCHLGIAEDKFWQLDFCCRRR